jgi:hypothetical protein
MTYNTSVNSFNRFQSILGKSSDDVVTITANNGNGTSQATTLNGTVITVKGESVAPPNNALIRGGEVIRQVPNLTVTTVSI